MALFNPLKIHDATKRLRHKPRKRFTWKKFGQIVLYFGLSFLFIVALLFAWFSKDLPTPGKIKRRYVIQSSQIFARDGKTPLYAISGSFRRKVIPQSEIPLNVQHATVAIEDKDFYHHIGVDFKGVARAFYRNFTRKRISQGGSTITQQFVKNALLSPKRTYTRKIKEVILSLEIEIMYSKDQVLTMYLNEIPYGSNAYGVEAASQTYFNKHAKDLNLNESAILAALPQAPTYYTNHKDDLKVRRNLVLRRMVEQNYITQQQADEAKQMPVKFIPRRENITAPHFVMYLKEVLIEKYGEKMVEEGGLKIVSTLDPNKQKIAEKVVSGQINRLHGYGASNAGLVSINPRDGQILAMVGSVDYFNTDNDGNFNVTVAERQPGSSFKPLVYAAGFKEKYNPASNLFDLTTNFGGYTPKNYDGRTRGPVTIRTALGNSLNIPAVKMLGLVGIDKALDTAHDMGITTLQDRNRYGLSLVLGGGEVKPLDMATAYGVFADSGTLHPTTPILKVEDANGNVLEEWSDKEKKQVLDPQVAYEISNVLSDVNAKKPVFSFAMDSLTLKDRPAAVKTGTTNAYRDAWTIGYTPSLVTAVWAGNNDNRPMTAAGGAIAAAPIWDAYMEQALSGSKKENFWRPPGIKEVVVDKMSNKLPSQYSPQTIKDIFASWQVPTERDDIHVMVRVCIDNGLLAPKGASDNYTEEKLFTNIHSEFPDRPNWETPVRAWARSHSMGEPAPTEYCKISDIKPAVSITSPNNNATVSGNFTIEASASADSGIEQVEFFIDDVSIATDDSKPYSTTYNANELSNGYHEIAVRATANNGSSYRAKITIKVGNDASAPGEVTNVSGTSSGDGKVTLEWTNPDDDDLASIRIYVSDHNGLGNLAGEFPANPGSTQQVTLSNLGTGSKCFTLRAVDASGNERTTSSPQICLSIS